jgi:DNA invertase Pin-like site-specific DNA recombinase
MTSSRRAIGIVRVSHVGDRDGDSFASPGEQRDRLNSACERDGLELVHVVEELDVSGGTPLERRHGLRQAIEAVEAGEAEVIVAAYFDRLVRSLRVQAEVVERVEAKGGQVLALDVGQVTNGTAGQWLSGTMLGAVSEYHRRSTGDRVKGAHIRAVERGAWPGRVPPGYLRLRDDGVLEPDPATAPIVAEAFRMRAAGSSIQDVRAYLAAHGIERSHHGVQRLLASKVVLGHIYFGDHVKLDAHPAIVGADVWRCVQEASAPRGRQAKSERLLARLGVLRCGTCGSRMVVTSSNGGAYPVYRCSPTGDCDRRVSIGAGIVEGLVVDAVKAALADSEGRASAEQGARQAAAELERAQAELDALIDMLDPLEPKARERLATATQNRDQAREQVDRLGGHRVAVTLNAVDDWDRLSLDARRALIRAVVDRAEIAPGRGADRVTVHLVGE